MIATELPGYPGACITGMWTGREAYDSGAVGRYAECGRIWEVVKTESGRCAELLDAGREGGG